MAVSIVNGFFCANSCDVRKAKKGEDPHPSVGTREIDADRTGGPSNVPRFDQPAVLFGGSLSGESEYNLVTAPNDAHAVQPTNLRTQALDILV
jgi:hypothetical protein